VLIAGYIGVWLCFAILAAALQAGAARASLLDSGLTSASPLFSGAILIGAGAYQFSSLKHACVTLCRRPSMFFLAQWSSTTSGVFRLGVRQGLYCLGCCFAMMIVMFAVGVMNVVWMAGLGLVMGIEKITSSTRFSAAIGIVFVLLGVGVIASAIVAQWPVRAA
jgi:predicted metal-binding membrane protein